GFGGDAVGAAIDDVMFLPQQDIVLPLFPDFMEDGYKDQRPEAAFAQFDVEYLRHPRQRHSNPERLREMQPPARPHAPGQVVNRRKKSSQPGVSIFAQLGLADRRQEQGPMREGGKFIALVYCKIGMVERCRKSLEVSDGYRIQLLF